MIRVVIAPGHYELHKGVFKNDVHEYDLVRVLADKIFSDLQRLEGVEPFLVRGTVKRKVNEINKLSPDVVIELHLGNADGPSVTGARAFYRPEDPASSNLASTVLRRYCDIIGANNNGSMIGWYKKITPDMVKAKRSPPGWEAKIDLLLQMTSVPVVQFEPFYISSPDDVASFSSDAQMSSASAAIVDGIMTFLGRDSE